ncbi:MAG TPA: 1,4-dihydroxy-2-naphthoate octaprenyltransferase [Microscillaceae bacterium]|nr:1,4-dihydroxy-2-naphthoate octaprenyltransferase [Microscillaceae bacterium]
MVKHWISAFRLRTLPLALASIGMGSFLAGAYQLFSLKIFLLAAFTTIFLQILSNLANDYGDSIHGADSDDREGPQRAVQSGAISRKAMYRAMIVFGVLSFVCGITLLYVAINSWQTFFFFLGLGVLSIIAAITYTAGKKPYGYAGLGDISVVIFFGWVAVLGTFYLHAHLFHWTLLLPATTCGLFATAVLNVNNIRDIESDKKAGKKSIPVRMGRSKAVIYHWILLSVGLLCALGYVLINFQSGFQLMFLVIIPLLWLNARAVKQKTEAAQLDPYLKQMALTTLIFVLTFGIGQLVI